MRLPELSEAELFPLIGPDSGSVAVLVVTPLCGTCQLAERMLFVAVEAGVGCPVWKINIHFAPILRSQWKMASVPCLVLLRDGKPVQMERAIRSTDHLYRLLNNG